MAWQKRESAKSAMTVALDGSLVLTMSADTSHPVGNTTSGTVILSEYHGDVPVAGGKDDERLAIHASVYHVNPSRKSKASVNNSGSVDNATLATMTAILQTLAAQNAAMAARLDAVESKKK